MLEAAKNTSTMDFPQMFRIVSHYRQKSFLDEPVNELSQSPLQESLKAAPDSLDKESGKSEEGGEEGSGLSSGSPRFGFILVQKNAVLMMFSNVFDISASY